MNKVKLNTASQGAPAGAELEVIDRNTNSMVLRTEDRRHIVVPLSHIDEIPDVRAQQQEEYREIRDAQRQTLEHFTEAGKTAAENGDHSPNQMVDEPPFAETDESQPLWDENALVFVNPDGSIAQPRTDEERKKRGLPSVEEDFNAMSPEDQANAHITGNETTEELEARGFKVESAIQHEIEAEEDEILAAKEPTQEPEQPDKEDIGFEDETEQPEAPEPAKPAKKDW